MQSGYYCALSFAMALFLFPNSSLLVATSDITVLSDDLPEEYQVPLEADHSHQLEYEFHSANYHTLKVIVIGLQTAVQLLVKVRFTFYSNLHQVH